MSVLALLASTAGSGSGGTTGPRPINWATDQVHVHIDGPSFYDASLDWAWPDIETLGSLAGLLSGPNVTHTNSAVSGQKWSEMLAAISDVHTAYVAGRYNVLIAGNSATNDLFFGTTRPLAEIQADITAYVAQVKATHPWDAVIVDLSIPRGGASTDAYLNGQLTTLDAWLIANQETLAIDVLVNHRTRSPSYYDYPGTSLVGFMSSAATCRETTGERVHPVGAARIALADNLAWGLQQVEVSA